MKCRHCGSFNVYRSHRVGLKEGLWLRIVHRAPYRCHDCQARFYAPKSKTVRGGHERSLAEYLGLRGRDYSVRNWMVTAVIAVILLVVCIVCLLRVIG